MAGIDDIQAIESLLRDVREKIKDDTRGALETAQSAVEMAEALDPQDPELLFEALFLATACHTVLEENAQGFASALRLIAMVENPRLDIRGGEGRIPMVYGCCAINAMDMASLQPRALSILEKGIASARERGSEGSGRYLNHEKSKFLIVLGQFDEALHLAEQLVGERRLQIESGGCDLDCYQSVYARALGFARSPQAGIDYLEQVMGEEEATAKLMLARADLRFRLGDYPGCIEDCDAASLIDDFADGHMLKARAQLLTGDREAALASLQRHPLGEDGDGKRARLWHAIVSSDIAGLTGHDDRSKWVDALIGYFLGNRDWEALQQAAAGEDDPDACRAEAWMLRGLQAWVLGDDASAADCCERACALANDTSSHHMWATACLRRLRDG